MKVIFSKEKGSSKNKNKEVETFENTKLYQLQHLHNQI